MQSWKRYHVNCELSKIGIELARKAKARGNARHCGRHQMVQVTVGWRGQLQRTETDIVESLIVDAKGLVGVFDKLVNRKCGIIGLDDCVRDLQG